jgi:hypothetical protein
MLKFQDAASIGATKQTQDGFLIATSRVARIGVQTYRADELGMTGSHAIRVYRAPDQVFSKDALKSLQHAPVTLNHPSELVTSDNWAKYAKGEVSTDILRDGEFLAVSLMVKDADTASAAKSTHREISLGYTAELTIGDGVSPDGEKYDAVMTDFNFNHLALVPKGRAGIHARIGDADHWGASPVTTKGPEMELTKVVIGDKAINVAASDADIFTKLIADKDTAIGTLKAELADAMSKILSDADLETKVIALADAKSKRVAVQAKFGDEAIKDASDAEIAGMYRVIGDAKDDTARKAITDMKPKNKDDESEFWAKIEAKKSKKGAN